MACLLFHHGFTTTIPLQYVINNSCIRVNFENCLQYSAFQKLLFSIIKNLTKYNILSTFAFKNYRKFVNHNLEKLCSRSFGLVSTIPVFGLERICFRKVGPWPPTFFFRSLPQPRSTSPRFPDSTP